ncbi:MAG TPA: putative glycoside hydrolase [Solirubrobacteraceae bacterium]|nr:putative glycoside hydrolase [Solirubrobacteraceae bacterium]
MGHIRRSTALATLLATLALTCAPASGAAADSAGTVHFVRSADTAFNQYTSDPSPEAQEWLRTHLWRMTVWSPYFDQKTAWFPDGWVYDDAYAIYTEEKLASEHPEWILRDASGNKLYIPYGCSGQSCPQYAADISDPGYRHYWIENLKAEVSHGYRGVFIDDVNMNMQVGNGSEQHVAPIDPQTGEPMSEEAWRHYMAEFMAEVRSALPGVEIVHNAIWFADEHAGTSDPDIRSEISCADIINLERGANDSGLTGGNGPWSLNALFAYVDEVHALGRGVVMDGSASEPQGLEYNLAAYFLISDGSDAVSGSGQTPQSWWSGWSTDLGEADGPRYESEGLLRRDFSGGMVLLNPPGEPTRTVTLANPMQDGEGRTVTSVTLAGKSAVILKGDPGTVPSASPRTTVPLPTQTIVEPQLLGEANVPFPERAITAGTGAARGRAARSDRARRTGRPSARVLLALIGGRVLRATQGTVAVLLEVRHGPRWVELRRVATGLSGRGRFRLLLRLRAARRYRVLALYRGAPGYRPSRSDYRQISVRRVGHQR